MDKGALTKFVESLVERVRVGLNLTEGEVKTARSLVGLQLKARQEELVVAALRAGGAVVEDEVAAS